MHAFEIGDLLLIKHWDEEGRPMLEAPAALVIDKYVAVPQVFPNDPKGNEDFVGTKQQYVYDVLFDGHLERNISENWLHAFIDPLGKVVE